MRAEISDEVLATHNNDSTHNIISILGLEANVGKRGLGNNNRTKTGCENPLEFL